MKLILLFGLVSTASAWYKGCGTDGDCLKACRSCKVSDIHNDGEECPSHPTFLVGSNRPGDCKQLICHDKNATLVVDGHSFPSLVCFQGRWHFGFPEYLEETEVAACITPPSNLDCDPNANTVFETDQFVCKCKCGYKDISQHFPGKNPGQVCSQCGNKRLNIIILIDTSGSMAEYWHDLKSGLARMIRLFQVSAAGNNIALVTASTTWNIISGWGPDAYNEDALLGFADSLPEPDGLSNLAAGMEAVKAALVQPSTDRDGVETVLIVVTDGIVKVKRPCDEEIPRAARKLAALNVDLFAVGTNAEYTEKLVAITNGNAANVIISNTTSMDTELTGAIQLQSLVCA